MVINMWDSHSIMVAWWTAGQQVQQSILHLGMICTKIHLMSLKLSSSQHSHHAPGAGLIARPIDLQSSALPLYHSNALWLVINQWTQIMVKAVMDHCEGFWPNSWEKLISTQSQPESSAQSYQGKTSHSMICCRITLPPAVTAAV